MAVMSIALRGANLTIGHRIRRAREGRQWDQSELARRAGVSSSYISKLESNSLPKPGVAKLAAVAAALGLRVTDLTGPPDAAEADEQALRAQLLALGFSPGEEPLMAEILADLVRRPEHQRGDILRALRTLIPPQD